MSTDYLYPAEKFTVARHNLMLPHSKGEHDSISHAFHECHLGLMNIDRSKLPNPAHGWVRRLDELMNTKGLDDPDKEGLWAVKARTFTTDEKIELSRLIDELAHWFDYKSHEK